MFERFTDRARKVMCLAEKAAHELNHEYLSTEHILLGLASESSGVAVNVLKNLNVTPDRIRAETLKIVMPAPQGAVVPGRLPRSPRCNRALEAAIRIASERGDNYVGTEHMLMGLLTETESIAVQVLLNLGVTADMAQAEVGILMDSGRKLTAKDAAWLDGQCVAASIVLHAMFEAFQHLELPDEFAGKAGDVRTALWALRGAVAARLVAGKDGP